MTIWRWFQLAFAEAQRELRTLPVVHAHSPVPSNSRPIRPLLTSSPVSHCHTSGHSGALQVRGQASNGRLSPKLKKGSKAGPCGAACVISTLF